MIEIIYNDSGKRNGSVIVKPPKNIRQIGSPRGRNKIYVEDYVYTFLHSPVFEGDSGNRAAVLLGKSEVAQDIRYTFISGAISCDDFVFQGDSIVFDESCWEYIYKEIKQYFDSQEVVGWFLGMPGFPLEITPAMEAAHRKYFAGRDKVLFLSESAEGEDSFYAYEQGILQKKEGYYIYYEKNPSMQEYMVCTKEKARESGAGIEDRMNLTRESIIPQECMNLANKSIMLPENHMTLPADDYQQEQPVSDEVPDDFFQKIEEATDDEEAIEPEIFSKTEEQETQTSAEQALQNYRTMLLDKEKKRGSKKMSLFLYTAASAAMVILCVIGITTLNNYEKMKEVEATLSLISQSSEDEVPASTQPSGLVVESVPGDVAPQTEQGQDTGNGENTQNKEATPNVDQAAGTDTAAQGKAETGTDETQGSGTSDGTDGTTQGTQTDVSAQGGGNTDASGTETQGGNDEAEKTNQGTEGTETQNQGTGKDNTADAQETAQTDTRTAAQVYLEQGYYVVQPGDRLETICKNIYQTTAMLDKLCEANQIDDVDKIYAGQKLTLP